ncbi:MAG TPA: cytochrome b/b6 domain-containing protein [Burkholderiales bacterium]|nr:cytochrome b/b6 domain-containing protein [Burkholderiales bacterium]
MTRWRNSQDRYGIIAQGFHWLVAALVLAQFALGLYAADLPLSLARLQWLSRHKALGLGVLALVLLRLGWRALDRAPALPDSMPAWERRAARATHRLLYALLVLAALAGWLYASAAGLSVDWFGLFRVPDLVAKNAQLAMLFKDAHKALVALFALLLLVHVGAALRHVRLTRDGVMYRMLPWNPAGKR